MHLNAWHWPVNIHCSIVSLRFCANVGSEKQKTRQNGRNLDPVNHRCERLVVKQKHLSRKDPNDNCALQAGIALYLICYNLSFGSDFWFANCHLNEVSQIVETEAEAEVILSQVPISNSAACNPSFGLFSLCLSLFLLLGIRCEYLAFGDKPSISQPSGTSRLFNQRTPDF